MKWQVESCRPQITRGNSLNRVEVEVLFIVEGSRKRRTRSLRFEVEGRGNNGLRRAGGLVKLLRHGTLGMASELGPISVSLPLSRGRIRDFEGNSGQTRTKLDVATSRRRA